LVIIFTTSQITNKELIMDRRNENQGVFTHFYLLHINPCIQSFHHFHYEVAHKLGIHKQ